MSQSQICQYISLRISAHGKKSFQRRDKLQTKSSRLKVFEGFRYWTNIDEHVFFSVQVSNACNALEGKYLLPCAMKNAGLKDLNHSKQPTSHWKWQCCQETTKPCTNIPCGKRMYSRCLVSYDYLTMHVTMRLLGHVRQGQKACVTFMSASIQYRIINGFLCNSWK